MEILFPFEFIFDFYIIVDHIIIEYKNGVMKLFQSKLKYASDHACTFTRILKRDECLVYVLYICV